MRQVFSLGSVPPYSLVFALVTAAVACQGQPMDPPRTSPGGAGGPGAGGGGGPGGSGGRPMPPQPPPAGGQGGTGGVGGTGGAATPGRDAGSIGGTGGGGLGGRGGSGGSGGSGGRAGGPDASMGGSAGTGTPPGDAGPGGTGERFSFFYTSLAGMQRLSNSQKGFGGDLRFGQPTGLAGADLICQTLAGAAGAGKTWRAFLSATAGPDGMPVHAIDRIGEGPWYDRNGRLISMNKAGLIGTGPPVRGPSAGDRPAGDPQAVADFADETGAGTKRLGDTHDAITGTNRMGRLASTNPAATCQDWTSIMGRGPVVIGHAWPAFSGTNWIQAHPEPSCAPGVNLVQTGPGDGSSIGAGGGWGGFYCFALSP